jgi:CelD/BcsL family acetyltransferase involved in cellulose biosynthesis
MWRASDRNWVQDRMNFDNPGAPEVRFSFDPISDLDAVGTLWEDLETRSDHSLFQSWGWIGTWLASLPARERPGLLVGRCDGRVVALATLGRRMRWRYGWQFIRGLFLNETGDPRLDALTIEYNGILTERALGPAIAIQALRYLLERVEAWDELCLSGVAEPDLEASRAVGLQPHIRAHQPCDYVDLAAIRAAGGDYLTQISRNARYQIRRALRRYEERGELSVTAAASVGEALEFLAALKTLHQSYWVSRGKPGSFANPYFERFHCALVRNRFAHGEIELLRIAAGNEPVGYLYNLVRAGHVYGYQSGFRYEDDPAVKPGLVSHFQAIERHLAAGTAIYDFMAGGAQHKQSLGTHRTTMIWLTARRPRLRYRLEDALRAAKHRIGPRAADRVDSPEG